MDSATVVSDETVKRLVVIACYWVISVKETKNIKKRVIILLP
jgi:hypothetical protein